MSLVGAPSLIEFAIRVGIDDILKDPNVLRYLLNASPLTNEGPVMSPAGSSPVTHDPLPMDYFQQRLKLVPHLGDETGKTDIFRNSIPRVEDVQKILGEGNMKIIHGFPQDTQDIPCLSIVLGNEDEGGGGGQQYLGTQKKVVQTPDGRRYVSLGSEMDAQFNLQILSTNYDETMAWYYAIKYSLWAYRKHIMAYGFNGQRMTWQDIEPAPEYLQAGLFVYSRGCVLSGILEEDILVPEDAYTSLAFSLATPEGHVADSDQQVIPDQEDA